MICLRTTPGAARAGHHSLLPGLVDTAVACSDEFPVSAGKVGTYPSLERPVRRRGRGGISSSNHGCGLLRYVRQVMRFRSRCPAWWSWGCRNPGPRSGQGASRLVRVAFTEAFRSVVDAEVPKMAGEADLPDSVGAFRGGSLFLGWKVPEKKKSSALPAGSPPATAGSRRSAGPCRRRSPDGSPRSFAPRRRSRATPSRLSRRMDIATLEAQLAKAKANEAAARGRRRIVRSSIVRRESGSGWPRASMLAPKIYSRRMVSREYDQEEGRL